MTRKFIATLGLLAAVLFAGALPLGAVAGGALPPPPPPNDFPPPVVQPKAPRPKAKAPKGDTIKHKNWHVRWRVEKFRNCKSAKEAARRKPDEVVQHEENLLTNAGITAMLNLLAGTGTYNAFNNANSYLWVGNGTTAAAASQTALQGASKTSKAMDATYPQVSGQTITFRSTYGSADANHAWEEVGVSNGATISGNVVLLNRKVTSFGTKASGSTWTMTLTITIS